MYETLYETVLIVPPLLKCHSRQVPSSLIPRAGPDNVKIIMTCIPKYSKE